MLTVLKGAIMMYKGNINANYVKSGHTISNKELSCANPALKEHILIYKDQLNVYIASKEHIIL